MTPAERLAAYAAKPSRLLLGLMSGTSVDAVTAAVVELRGAVPDVQVALRGAIQHPMPPEIAEAVLAHDHVTAAQVTRLNVRIGELFAEAALAVLDRLGIAPGEVDAIASHGQTLCHLPEHSATLQLGEPSIIAERTGVLTVAEFRYRDMAAGGQGAPLVPLADFALFRDSAKARAVQNIGGIANVTYIPAAGALDDVIAFDTGPGNMVIDGVMAVGSQGHFRMDEDGRFAAGSEVREPVVQFLMEDDYFHTPPPKTAGREQFGIDCASTWLRQFNGHGDRYHDLIATFTALTAESISHAYRTYLPKLPDEMVVGGGGAKNPSLMAMIAERLPEVTVLTHADFGIDDAAKEAIAFCILANETLLGRPGNVPSATGARRPVVLGKIVLP